MDDEELTSPDFNQTESEDGHPELWSYDTRFEFVVHGLLISFMGSLGLLGNLAAIVVLTRPQMRNSINTMLTALVSSDCLVILTGLLMFSFTAFHHTGWLLFETYNLTIYPYIVPFVYPLALTVQTCSAYLTMAVTVERYLAVCWPLKARSICTIGKAKTAIGCVASFAVIYNIPRFFEIKTIQHFVGHCDNPQSNDDQMEVNTTKPGYFPTDLRMNNIYINVYVTWMYLVFMYIIPFSTLAVFNILTYLEIRRALARRAQLSAQEIKEHNLATMLIMVVMVFFICNLLALLVNILELTPYYKLVPKLSQISNGLVIINSSMNILIYCTFGKKFRTVFMQIFFGKQPPCIITTSRSVAHTYGNKKNHINHTQNSYMSNNSTTNGNGSETVPLTSFPNHLDLPNTRTPNRSRVETRQFTVRIERIGADTPHITLTNNHNGNGDTYIESDDDEDTDAISYANDQKSVGTQAKLLI